MCTLSYIPIDSQQFFWVQNRDESPKRHTLQLVKDDSLGVLYPKDPLSGGSWIAASKNNRVVSLLNGAFVQQPYQISKHKSRGLVVLDAIQANSIVDFLNNYELKGIEPFTMIIRDAALTWELRWDKNQKYFCQIHPKYAYVWSSSMLYYPNVKAMRQRWFRDFLRVHPVPSLESVQNFHLKAGVNNPEIDLVMNRPYVQTVSMTSVICTQDAVEMQYHDLVQNESQSQHLTFI